MKGLAADFRIVVEIVAWNSENRVRRNGVIGATKLFRYENIALQRSTYEREGACF